MKTTKIIYWSATILLSLLLIMSSGMYIFQNEMIQEVYINLGYPTYLIYPLVVAKLSAVTVLLTQKPNLLKEWAYAGLFFEFILAFFAHIMINDGEHLGAVMAMILLILSYIYGKKMFKTKN